MAVSGVLLRNNQRGAGYSEKRNMLYQCLVFAKCKRKIGRASYYHQQGSAKTFHLTETFDKIVRTLPTASN